MHRRLALLLCTVALALACRAPTDALDEVQSPGDVLIGGTNATVVWVELEGGFWGLLTDAGSLLDPHASLPIAFREHGLRVSVRYRNVPNAACIHMAGPIVSVTEIRRR